MSVRSVCRGTETSEHLAAQAAENVNNSCLNYAKSEPQFTQSLTKTTGATTRLSRRHNVNTSLDQTGETSLEQLHSVGCARSLNSYWRFVPLKRRDPSPKGMTDDSRGEEMLQLVLHLLAPCPINLPVSETSGASLLCWIDLHPISL